jgi:hypothetical protein
MYVIHSKRFIERFWHHLHPVVLDLQAAKEVQTALSMDYPSTATGDIVTAGLDRPLDRWLNPMARAFALKADLQPPGDSGGPAGEDELVVLLERARDCKNPSIRSDYLIK